MNENSGIRIESVVVEEMATDLILGIEKIYTEAFPAEERRDWNDLLIKNREGRIDLKVIYVNDKIAGLITLWDFGGMRYIEHFAISPQLRGRGAGSKVLACLKSSSTVPLILEAEPPGATSMAASRLEFYARNGFHIIARDYIQPPYNRGLSSVALYILSTDERIEGKMAGEILHREVYGRKTGIFMG